MKKIVLLLLVVFLFSGCKIVKREQVEQKVQKTEPCFVSLDEEVNNPNNCGNKMVRDCEKGNFKTEAGSLEFEILGKEDDKCKVSWGIYNGEEFKDRYMTCYFSNENAKNIDEMTKQFGEILNNCEGELKDFLMKPTDLNPSNVNDQSDEEKNIDNNTNNCGYDEDCINRVLSGCEKDSKFLYTLKNGMKVVANIWSGKTLFGCSVRIQTEDYTGDNFKSMGCTIPLDSASLAGIRNLEADRFFRDHNGNRIKACSGHLLYILYPEDYPEFE